MNVLYIKAVEEKKIDSIPDSPVAKATRLKKLYEDEIIIENMNTYLLFRRLIRSEYSKRNEYRRYVTMIANDNGTIVEIDIDSITEYFDRLRLLFNHVKTLVTE
jgi:hypothetical protein